MGMVKFHPVVDAGIIPRKLEDITTIVLHRLDLGTSDVDKIAAAFRDTAPFAAGSYTGGQFPYTFIVPRDGELNQALALEDVGVHAARFNHPSISIACLGDFRKHAPTQDQWSNCVGMCVILARLIGKDHHCIFGHDELKGSSKDPHKSCPGRYFDMTKFRRDVQETIAKLEPDFDPEAKLRELGVRIRLVEEL